MDASATPIRGYYSPSMYDPNAVPLSIMQENLMRGMSHDGHKREELYSHVIKPSMHHRVREAKGGSIWDDIQSGIEGVGNTILSGIGTVSKFLPLLA